METEPVQTGGVKFKISKEVQEKLASEKRAKEEAAAKSTAEPPKPATDAPKPPTEVPKPPTEAPTGEVKKARTFRIASKKRAEETAATTTEGPLDESLTHKEKLARFFKGRKQNPEKYTYSADGNLVVLDDSGQPSVTIPTRSFRSLNKDEVIELSKQRMDEVRKYETGTPGEESKEEEPLSYVKAVEKLRDVYARYKRGETGFTEQTVVAANQEVKEAEQRRNNALHPIKFTNTIDNPVIRKIIVSSKDVRHMGHPVYRIGYYPFKEPDAFGHYVTPEEEAAQKSTMKGGSAIDVILIDSYEDPVRGFLHPAYTKDFSYTSTQYSSVYQAFEAERLKILKNQSLVDQLMKTRSPRTIYSIASQDKTPLPNSFDLWLSILKAFYQQNTDLAKQLVETGSAIFSLQDSIVSSPSDYLNALLSVRSIMAEGQEGGAVAPIEKRVITQEEQKKARAGAIINNRRFGAN
jgi:hypothetical protein